MRICGTTHEYPKGDPDGVTVMNTFTKTVSVEKDLMPGHRFPLYNLSAPIAFQVGSLFGGGFSEDMKAGCTATYIGCCRR